jgi:hypothetical protein
VIRIKDESGEMGLPKSMFRMDSLGQYDASLPFAAAQPGEGATESMQLYPWLRSQPKSLWTDYPARGMPTSPGATDEWAPLPAQGSSYAGKGVTMPDVPPKWDLGTLALGPEEEEFVNKVRWQFLAMGASGLILHPIWIWFLWRALKNEKALFFKIFGWAFIGVNTLGILGSASILASGIALSSKKARKELADKMSVPNGLPNGPFRNDEISITSKINSISNPVSSFVSSL